MHAFVVQASLLIVNDHSNIEENTYSNHRGIIAGQTLLNDKCLLEKGTLPVIIPRPRKRARRHKNGEGRNERIVK